jgi:hypothetical protein
MTKTTTPKLRPGARKIHEAMAESHRSGAHGDGTKEDVLVCWAEVCADCNAAHHYTFGAGRDAIAFRPPV